MPREKESYRDTLEDILTFFSGKRLLTKKDVALYTGLNYRTVIKRFKFNQNTIAATVLARELS
ncbi:hypothetical protein CE91St46_13230 [Eubacteriales bacterium]|nr:hypothetical protein CE91St46_13230 [Eubacteriales bacterium]GKH62849.1 hypothetical protein CE91St47_13180 [Eubacteriales bacterium]